jgi:hypothetical protein
MIENISGGHFCKDANECHGHGHNQKKHCIKIELRKCTHEMMWARNIQNDYFNAF